MGKENVFNYVHSSLREAKQQRQWAEISKMTTSFTLLLSTACRLRKMGWSHRVKLQAWPVTVKGLKAQKQLESCFLRTAVVLAWGESRGEMVWRHFKQTYHPSSGHVRTRTATWCPWNHTEKDIFKCYLYPKYFLSLCESNYCVKE